MPITVAVRITITLKCVNVLSFSMAVSQGTLRAEGTTAVYR